MIKVMAVIAGIAVVPIAALLAFAASKPDTFRSSPTSSAGSSPGRIASMRGPTPCVAKIVHVLFDMHKMVGSDFEVVAPERVVIVCTADAMQKGWAQTVDRLNTHLHTKP